MVNNKMNITNTYICIPAFDYKITFVNSQNKNKYSKGDFEYIVLNVCFKDFWYTKINLTQIWYDFFN